MQGQQLLVALTREQDEDERHRMVENTMDYIPVLNFILNLKEEQCKG